MVIVLYVIIRSVYYCTIMLLCAGCGRNSVYDRAFEYVMYNEGVYSNDPQDPGGETWYGISKRFLKSVNIEKASFTKKEANSMYYCYFWLPAKCNLISEPRIAIKYFDMTVQFGHSCATILMQNALNELSDQKVVVDGIMRKENVDVIKKVCMESSESKLLDVLCKECKKKYLGIIANNPTMSKWRKIWLKRAERVPQ